MMVYRRFIAPMISMVFAQIAEADMSEPSKRYHRRRAFNRMGGYSYKPNGGRECLRRRLQILDGRLTAANGLVALP